MRLDLNLEADSQIFFMKCIRYMLSHTFLLKEKNEELFTYVSDPTNMNDMRSYLAVIGFDLQVDTGLGIAMIKPAGSAYSDTRDPNLVHFGKCVVHLILVLWQIYLERIKLGQNSVITLGELVDRVTAYDLEVANDKRKLSSALQDLKKYDLIYFSDKDLKSRSEEMPITLYPSLQFGWDIAQLKEVMSNYSDLLDDRADNELTGDEEFTEEEEYA